MKIVAALYGYVQQGQLLDGLALANLPKLSIAAVELAKVVLAVKLTPKLADEPGGSPKLAADTSVGKVTDKLRNVLDALKGVMASGSKLLVNELESIKYMSSGFFWNEEYPKGCY